MNWNGKEFGRWSGRARKRLSGAWCCCTDCLRPWRTETRFLPASHEEAPQKLVSVRRRTLPAWAKDRPEPVVKRRFWRFGACRRPAAQDKLPLAWLVPVALQPTQRAPYEGIARRNTP